MSPLAAKCCCCRPKRNNCQFQAWASIYRIAKTPFNEENVMHHRVLNSLHKYLTGSSHPPPRLGPHWITIGFQSNNPITDLRAAGMLGLLVPLGLFAKFETLGQKVLRLSRVPDQDFPLMLVLIVFVDASIRECNQSELFSDAKSLDECWKLFMFYFAGLVYQLCQDWEANYYSYADNYDYFYKVIKVSAPRPLATVNLGRKAAELDQAIPLSSPLLQEMET